LQQAEGQAGGHPDAKAGPLARAHHLQLREPHLVADQLANLLGQVLNKVRGRLPCAVAGRAVVVSSIDARLSCPLPPRYGVLAGPEQNFPAFGHGVGLLHPPS
jgi:hypothetical protein